MPETRPEEGPVVEGAESDPAPETGCAECGCDEDLCEHCDNCADCCCCRTCESCDGRIRDRDWRCGDCSCCEGCCSCCEDDDYCDDDDDEAAVNFCDRALAFHFADGTREFHSTDKDYLDRPARKGFARNPSRRFIACELEVVRVESWYEGVEDVCRRRYHSVVRDSSLNGECGFEVNTSPAQGDVFVKNVEELCAALNHHGAEVDSSCGYHVHVDARDFGYWDIRRLCRLYARIESALFQCVSRGRRNSSYCQPCGQRYLELARGRRPKELFAKAVYDAESARCLRHIKASKYVDARYSALNLHSWLFRGTVECRMHQGTCSARKVILWGVLWAGLLDYVARAGEAEIDALKGDSFDVLLAVSPTDEVREHLRERRETLTRAREDS